MSQPVKLSPHSRVRYNTLLEEYADLSDVVWNLLGELEALQTKFDQLQAILPVVDELLE